VWERVSSWVRERRRRIASAVLAVFVLIVIIDLANTAPRASELAFDLGAGHASIREVTLSYVHGDEAVREARRRFADGAPSRLTDTLDLVPGHYSVHLALTDRDGRVTTRAGEFDAPSDGLVVVHLDP